MLSEQEFDQRYQYGIVRTVNKGWYERVRSVEIVYQNHNENTKWQMIRGAHDVVVIHKVDELPSNQFDSFPSFSTFSFFN